MKGILEHCNTYMKGNGSLPPGHDDNNLRSLIVRVWSLVQVQAEKSAFSSLASLISERTVGQAMAVHLKLVLEHLWTGVLSKMRMIDSKRAVIPFSEMTFARGFGWMDETELLFGSGRAQELSERARSSRVKSFIKDMVDRGITIRHQTAHAVGTDQVDTDPFNRRRHSLRQSTSVHRATEHAPSAPLIPNPMDLLFALIAFDSVRLFFENK